MKQKPKYHPRNVRTEQINRFRGVIDEDGEHNVPAPYVGAMDNMPSTKIAQMDSRSGQVVDESFDSGINMGAHGTIASAIGEGSNLWIRLLSLLSPRGVALYLPPTIPDLPPLPPLPPPPPPPAEPPLPYWPPTQPPWFPPFVLPPLPPPPNFNFDPLIYTPENIQWAVQVGYSPANTTRKVYATFRNWDNITDDVGAESATATYTSDGIEYVEVKVSRTDPDGKGGYIEVEATVKLAADVAVGLKQGYVIFSSGYEYAYVPTTIKVEAAAPVSGWGWYELWRTYAEYVEALTGGLVVPDYNTYDFNDYDTGYNIILALQGRMSNDGILQYFAKDDIDYTGEIMSAAFVYTWELLKTASGLVNGFRRSTGGYGTIVYGDPLDPNMVMEDVVQLLPHLTITLPGTLPSSFTITKHNFTPEYVDYAPNDWDYAISQSTDTAVVTHFQTFHDPSFSMNTRNTDFHLPDWTRARLDECRYVEIDAVWPDRRIAVVSWDVYARYLRLVSPYGFDYIALMNDLSGVDPAKWDFSIEFVAVEKGIGPTEKRVYGMTSIPNYTPVNDNYNPSCEAQLRVIARYAYTYG